jgi:LPS export ABC transporter permease LptF
MLTTSIFIKEIKNYFIKVLLLLLFILPINESFKLLGQVSAGNLSYMALLDLMIYGTIAAFPMILTIASFTAITIATTNYCRNNYLIIYFTSGISIFSITKKILLFLIPLGMLSLICSFFITPWIITKSDRYTKYLQNKYDTAEIKEGVFKTLPYTNNVYYIESQSSDKKTLHNIFIEYNDNKNNKYNLTAEQAVVNTFNPQQIIINLTHGNRDQIYTSDQYINTIEFESSQLTILPQYNIILNDDIRSYHLYRLLNHLDQPQIRSELVWRISLGIMLITTTILAFPISIKLSRRTNNRHFVLIPLLYGLYQNLMYVIRSYTSSDYLHSMTWAFVLHLLIFILTIILIILKAKPKK